ncbi:hypothetical protein ABEB36_012739 [Hypothenemus hampei]|uniref:Cytochrome P450 n=1 Tax=Hypothenemus hampei TaxID=57062 RepID=A0ABD1EC91_HYPHA
MSIHLFNIRSPEWKALRQKLTPTFTSGKMKTMFSGLLKCSDYMIDFLQKEAQVGSDIDIKEILASFTTDVIGSTAFGVECNSFDESHNEFRKQGRGLFKANFLRTLKVILVFNFPDLAHKLGIRGNPSTQDFFANVVKQTMEHRAKNNIRRNDFLQILIDMNQNHKEGEKPFSFEEIVANTILFFIAGFDTSSTTMNFTLFELARHPEIQEKARQEIKKILEKYNGEVTYESLKEMTYLQQCIDESQRKFPPVVSLGRVCMKDYHLRKTDVIIEKGTQVAVSTFGLGMDPGYFPDPEKFDPERFSPAAKANRHPYLHIPFGEGPRNCIGSRFGLMQTRIGLVRLLTNFKFTLSAKTQLPLTFGNRTLLLKSNETLYLKAENI